MKQRPEPERAPRPPVAPSSGPRRRRGWPRARRARRAAPLPRRPAELRGSANCTRKPRASARLRRRRLSSGGPGRRRTAAAGPGTDHPARQWRSGLTCGQMKIIKMPTQGVASNQRRIYRAQLPCGPREKCSTLLHSLQVSWTLPRIVELLRSAISETPALMHTLDVTPNTMRSSVLRARFS